MKCDLLQVGGLSFTATKSVAFSAQMDGPTYEELPLSEPVKPLGGKWGEAKAVIIPIHKNRKWTRGEWISLPREAFPRLEGSEIYLCDLMGRALSHALDVPPTHVVIGIEDRSKGRKESISLIVRDGRSKKTFEVPLRGVDWSLSTDDLLVLPSLADWSELA
ncbi:MAG TPA: hypothetical protein VM901_11315 [Bdellovibrionota bacterium]|nr:hypothetical protein [Bdellovibrionota bacterium]